MNKVLTLAAVTLMIAGTTVFAGEDGKCTKGETTCSSEKKSDGCSTNKTDGASCKEKKSECTKGA